MDRCIKMLQFLDEKGKIEHQLIQSYKDEDEMIAHGLEFGLVTLIEGLTGISARALTKDVEPMLVNGLVDYVEDAMNKKDYAKAVSQIKLVLQIAENYLLEKKITC